MKTSAINLFILDDNTLMAASLSRYLIGKFGARINISYFFDVDKCIRSIDEQTHVVVVDYNIEGKRIKSGLGNLNYIKIQKPKTEVTLITSDKHALTAAEDLERGASEYITNKGIGPDRILFLLNKNVVSPIKTIVTLPAQKIVHYYNLRNYLMMFIITFISIAVLVIAAMLVWNYFTQ